MSPGLAALPRAWEITLIAAHDHVVQSGHHVEITWAWVRLYRAEVNDARVELQ